MAKAMVVQEYNDNYQYMDVCVCISLLKLDGERGGGGEAGGQELGWLCMYKSVSAEIQFTLSK